MAMVTSLRTRVNPGTHMVEREWTLSSCPLTSACTCTVVDGHTNTLVMKKTNKQTNKNGADWREPVWGFSCRKGLRPLTLVTLLNWSFLSLTL